MNSNGFHNLMNWVIGISGAFLTFMIFTGCKDVGETLDCSASWLNDYVSPGFLAIIITISGVLKTVVNIQRDGISGLFKKQPPVASNLTTVVVASNAEAGPAKVAVTGAMAATKK